MSFNKAVEVFGKAHNDVRTNGAKLLDIKLINLPNIARMAAEAGSSITEPGPWANAFDAALRANEAQRKAAYLIGYAVAPVKPPHVGPSIVIT